MPFNSLGFWGYTVTENVTEFNSMDFWGLGVINKAGQELLSGCHVGNLSSSGRSTTTTMPQHTRKLKPQGRSLLLHTQVNNVL